MACTEDIEILVKMNMNVVMEYPAAPRACAQKHMKCKHANISIYTCIHIHTYTYALTNSHWAFILRLPTIRRCFRKFLPLEGGEKTED